MLKCEKDVYESKDTRTKRVSKCCQDGAVHTKFMQAKFHELQNPPEPIAHYINDEGARDPKYLFMQKNWNAMNTNMAVGSTTVHQDPERLPAGIPVVKINGEVEHNASDIPPRPGKDGKPGAPIFGNHYTMDVEESLRHRMEAHERYVNRNGEKKSSKSTEKQARVAESVLRGLDKMMREHNPTARAYMTAAERLEAWKKSNPGKEVCF